MSKSLLNESFFTKVWGQRLLGISIALPYTDVGYGDFAGAKSLYRIFMWNNHISCTRLV